MYLALIEIIFFKLFCISLTILNVLFKTKKSIKINKNYKL